MSMGAYDDDEHERRERKNSEVDLSEDDDRSTYHGPSSSAPKVSSRGESKSRRTRSVFQRSVECRKRIGPATGGSSRSVGLWVPL